jgi:hypothetical protein
VPLNKGSYDPFKIGKRNPFMCGKTIRNTLQISLSISELFPNNTFYAFLSAFRISL